MTTKDSRSAVLIWAVAIAAILVVATAAWALLVPRLAPIYNMAAAPANEFERQMRQYILDHPEVILESMQRFEQRQQAAAQGAAQRILSERADEILRDAASPVGGNPEGNVTLVEFFDYNCPYCRRVAPIMAEAIAADRQLRVVYKEFPILGAKSLSAAKVALAAHAQDKSKYARLHDALMEHKGPADEKAALTAAADLGFDVEQLKADMSASEITASLDRNLSLAQALGINGTPAFIIGNRIIPGAVDLETLQGAIEEARASQQATQQ